LGLSIIVHLVILVGSAVVWVIATYGRCLHVGLAGGVVHWVDFIILGCGNLVVWSEVCLAWSHVGFNWAWGDCCCIVIMLALDAVVCACIGHTVPMGSVLCGSSWVWLAFWYNNVPWVFEWAFGLSMVGLGMEGASCLRPRPSWLMPVF